jgi:hypothetical protein
VPPPFLKTKMKPKYYEDAHVLSLPQQQEQLPRRVEEMP